MFVNRKQVVGLSPRFGEPFFEEFVEGFEILEPPILPRSNLAEILSQFNKSLVAFVLLRLLPGQDLIDLPENNEGPSAIEFGRHDGPSVNPQIRPANQGSPLLAFGSGS